MIKIIINPEWTQKIYAELGIVAHYAIMADIGLNSVLHCGATSEHRSHICCQKIAF